MTLQRTPLYEAHLALGARLVEFGGWAMPVQYGGIVAEHKACRAAMGLFDVCHMGEFDVTGDGAVALLERAVTNHVADLPVGRCRYALLCNAAGGVIDDLILYHWREGWYRLVVNAANIATDWAWLSDLAAGTRAQLVDPSGETGLLALQGPRSRALLERLLAVEERPLLSALRYYHCAEAELCGCAVTISRTGYTGDLGYEIFAAAAEVAALWDRLLHAGRPEGLVPVGLGARDTLRLEAGFPLHGHEISPSINPLEAGLGRFVKLDQPFVGRDALAAIAAAGPARTLVGLEVTAKGVIRDGCPILAAGEAVGVVTSGTFSPLLERSIGLGYVPPSLAAPGTPLAVDVRGRALACEVVRPPFYRPAG